MTFAFGITWRDDGTQHDDIYVALGDEQYVADSYYLAIESDDTTTPDESKTETVTEVLIRLLTGWMHSLIDAAPGDRVFLPFGFRDEAIDGIECTVESNTCRIRTGWIDREGWSIPPSDISRLITGAADCHAVEGAREHDAYLPWFINQLRCNISSLQHGPLEHFSK